MISTSPILIGWLTENNIPIKLREENKKKVIIPNGIIRKQIYCT